MSVSILDFFKVMSELYRSQSVKLTEKCNGWCVSKNLVESCLTYFVAVLFLLYRYEEKLRSLSNTEDTGTGQLSDSRSVSYSYTKFFGS
jgi:hypothetical protein